MNTRRFTALALLALALLALAGPGPARAEEGAAQEPPAKALCPVCRVHEGESELEEVEASAVYRGQTFHFCSERCRDLFHQDPEAYLPPVLPRPAPAFTVLGLDGGGEVDSRALAGRLTLLDFWATWCQPCIAAMPELDALHRRHGPRGFSVVGISIDEGEKAEAKAKKMVRRRGVTYPVYLDATAQPAWAAFHVRAIPAMFLLDAEGRVVAQWSGRIDLGEVEAAVVARLGR